MFKNPYISTDASPRYKIGDHISHDSNDIDLYNKLHCKNLPVQANGIKSLMYSDYENFINTYTPQKHEATQENLFNSYFANRPNYSEVCKSELIVEQNCDPEFYCC